MEILLGFAMVAWWGFGSAMVGIAAERKGYGGIGWFLGALLLCPAFAILLVIAHPHRAPLTG